MKRIISIERQKRSKKRYTLHFDDGEWLGLFDELVLKHDLKVGKEVDSKELALLAEEDDAKKAFEMSLRYLGYRSRSQKEMDTYLKGKGFEENIIEKIKEKLEDYGYIDDSAFARDWIASRMLTKPMGRTMLRMELLQKGIKDEIIKEQLEGISQEEEGDLAYNLAIKYTRRYRNLDAREKKQKIGAALARKGFDWETIKGAINRLNMDDADETDYL